MHFLKLAFLASAATAAAIVEPSDVFTWYVHDFHALADPGSSSMGTTSFRIKIGSLETSCAHNQDTETPGTLPVFSGVKCANPAVTFGQHPVHIKGYDWRVTASYKGETRYVNTNSEYYEEDGEEYEELKLKGKFVFYP